MQEDFSLSSRVNYGFMKPYELLLADWSASSMAIVSEWHNSQELTGVRTLLDVFELQPDWLARFA